MDCRLRRRRTDTRWKRALHMAYSTYDMRYLHNHEQN